MTKKEIDRILGFGSSHIMALPGSPVGVSKFQAFLAIKPVLKGKFYWNALRQAYDLSETCFYTELTLSWPFALMSPSGSSS